jgi:hypothetical protein
MNAEIEGSRCATGLALDEGGTQRRQPSFSPLEQT